LSNSFERRGYRTMSGMSLAVLTTLAASITIGGITAEPGTAVSRMIPIGGGADGAIELPVTVVHGAEPGPVVALIAGNHGYEYAPILALQRVLDRVRPTELRGTVVMVHVAAMPSFLARTVYRSPVDGKNLNRVYPGKAAGTSSERIAYFITEEVIEKASYVIDLHCGDGNEWLRPFVYMPVTGDATLDPRIEELVLAFGIDHILVDRSRKTEPETSLFCDMTAITRGIPAFTAESGSLGQRDDASVERIVDGVMSVLRHYRLLEGAPTPVVHPVFLEPSEVLTSPKTGVLHPQVEPGHSVAAGTLLAIVTDFFGREVARVTAPFAGEVLYVVATPPISEGEPVAMIATPKR
ncbi:MAG TPA: succinylglutamate desuccinylase/aspartoacylase family protein, partial [Vicinamibacteria bacterium]|nr:succinylglutamate desuccinylase/aspartoacylase family protein [Vicinamibacteria bacterium]